MADPVLHVIAGPNGAGKTTFYETVLGPQTGLPFVNADLIAAERWPGSEAAHGYDAAALAEQVREALIERRESFVAETVFSHPSKVRLVNRALATGYLVTLHVILVSVEGAVARVADRVRVGGHAVPEDRIRARYNRLWDRVAEAVSLATDARVYDNSLARSAFRLVAVYHRGALVGTADWPAWAPEALRRVGPGQD